MICVTANALFSKLLTLFASRWEYLRTDNWLCTLSTVKTKSLACLFVFLQALFIHRSALWAISWRVAWCNGFNRVDRNRWTRVIILIPFEFLDTCFLVRTNTIGAKSFATFAIGWDDSRTDNFFWTSIAFFNPAKLLRAHLGVLANAVGICALTHFAAWRDNSGTDDLLFTCICFRIPSHFRARFFEISNTLFSQWNTLFASCWNNRWTNLKENSFTHPCLENSHTNRITLIGLLIPAHFDTWFDMTTNTLRSESDTVFTCTWDYCWTDLKKVWKWKETIIRMWITYRSTCIRFCIPAHFRTRFGMTSNAFRPESDTVFTWTWDYCWTHYLRIHPFNAPALYHQALPQVYHRSKN